MELTNGTIFSAKEPLNQIISLKFPWDIAYEIAEIIISLNEQLEKIEMVRLSIVKKYGKEDEKEKGKVSISADSPNYFQFIDEYNALMLKKVEVNIQKVKIPKKVFKEACEGKTIEPSTIVALKSFVEICNDL